MKIEIKTDQALWEKKLKKHGNKGYSASFEQQTLEKLRAHREGSVYILTGNNTQGFDKGKPSGTGYVLQRVDDTALGSFSFSSLGRCMRTKEKIDGKEVEFLVLSKPDPNVS
jgi:hypothetical protein